jgi:hypothetical protein
MSETHSGEFAALRERLARALYDNGNITDKGWEDGHPADRGVAYEEADVALAALGLEQVGHAREYVEEGVGGIAAVYDVGDEPPWEYGTSDYTVPVFRMAHSDRQVPSDG